MLITKQTRIPWLEIKILLGIAFPLICGGFVEASVGFSSTWMLAHLGHYALAAGALVNTLFVTLMVFMWGILGAISMLVSHRHGANDVAGVARVYYDGLCLSLIISVIMMIVLWNAPMLLLLLGQHPQSVALAKSYLHALTWAVIPDFFCIVFLQLVLGLGHTRVNFLFSLVWVPMTILANYVFIFGKWGIPAFGIAGIGWGTATSYWVSTIVFIIYLYLTPRYRPYLSISVARKQPSVLKELLNVGMPVGGMMCIEVGYFMVLALLMGRISITALAANQIIWQYIGQFVVAVFAMAQAATVRIGHTIGGKDIPAAYRAGILSMGIAFVFMCVTALVFWFLPNILIGIDINIHEADNQQLVIFAKQFLALAAVFLIFESVRITAFGALRGLRDTRFTLLISMVMFWGIALPVGYYLGFILHWGGSGLWAGMAVGASVGAYILVRRFKQRIKIYDAYDAKKEVIAN